jgi:hypothetical protein
MNITFHGLTGVLAAFLACAGVATVACGIWDSLAARFRADLRHLRVHRRWDRPGAHVTFGGGRRGIVSDVVSDKNAGGMAIICPYDGDGQEMPAEWVSLGDLAPLPHPAVTEDAA